MNAFQFSSCCSLYIKHGPMQHFASTDASSSSLPLICRLMSREIDKFPLDVQCRCLTSAKPHWRRDDV